MSIDKILETARSVGINAVVLRDWIKCGLVNTDYDYTSQQLTILHDQLRGAVYNTFTVLKGSESPFTAIELFSGCGGLALGLENAGFQHKLLVEVDRDASQTLKLNRPDWNVVAADVSTIDFTAYNGQVDLVAGGFPCQSFSYAGNRSGMDDVRGTLFFEFARCVKEIRPRIALAENVKGLLNHDGGKTLKTMVTVLEDMGYIVQYHVHHSQFMNVPQKRERLFIVAMRNDINSPFTFHQEGGNILTLREALSDCPQSVGAKYSEYKRRIFAFVPEGGNWRNLPDDLQREYMKGSLNLSGGKTGMARRLAWDEPSLTLTCSPSQNQTERCHPTETRPLTVREYARIQTFPDDWQFCGSINSQYRQIGNAVPVNMAFHVGRCLIEVLKSCNLT